MRLLLALLVSSSISNTEQLPAPSQECWEGCGDSACDGWQDWPGVWALHNIS